MEENSNLKIVQRLLELSRNEPGYNEERPMFPREYKQEQIWLANILSDSLHKEERNFKAIFTMAVAEYKMNLKKGKGYGWFNSGTAEKLEWSNTHINQMTYAIYGERFERPLRFKSSLKNKAYKDFINQIDRTVLMTPRQLKKHNSDINRISKELVKEILAKSKKV